MEKPHYPQNSANNANDRSTLTRTINNTNNNSSSDAGKILFITQPIRNDRDVLFVVSNVIIYIVIICRPRRQRRRTPWILDENNSAVSQDIGRMFEQLIGYLRTLQSTS